MKLKFPEGVLQYFDAEGNEHRPDADGQVTVHDSLLDRISHMIAAGFQKIEEAVEEIIEAVEGKTDEVEEVPTKAGEGDSSSDAAQ